MEKQLHQTLPDDKLPEEKGNKIIIEEIDPEEISKLWDSLPEIKSSF